MNSSFLISHNKDLKINSSNEHPNAEDIQYASAEKAKKVLGWNQNFNIDEGLKTTFNWYKENIDTIKLQE